MKGRVKAISFIMPSNREIAQSTGLASESVDMLLYCKASSSGSESFDGGEEEGEEEEEEGRPTFYLSHHRVII